MSLKDKASRFISYLIPNRIVYWVLIRAYAYSTVHSYPEKKPDEIGFNLLLKSWEKKTELWVNDKGYVKFPTVDHPNL